jgi:CRP/FNR family transcriptional regulator, cyclic AMP receptor protein
MTIGNPPSEDLESAIRALCGSAPAPSDAGAVLQGWRDEDVATLLHFTSRQTVKAGEALLRRGEPGRTFYFVLSGALEVMAHPNDGFSMGRLTLARAGSVIGEQSFFDGAPRSAGAWAVRDCELAAMTPEAYETFTAQHPVLARDLLFALGRVLALRLRSTTAKVVV